MVKFFSKYKLQLDILAVLVFGIIAVDKIFFEDSREKKNFSLFMGIMATLMMIVKVSDVFEGIKKKAE